MKKIKTTIILFVVFIALMMCCGCRPSTVASHNISKEADSFGVTRKITVVNMRTDSIMFEVTGTFSLQNTSTRELAIICMIGEGIYKKHFIYLNDWTSYVIEDISGADVDPYRYEIKIYPQIPTVEIAGQFAPSDNEN